MSLSSLSDWIAANQGTVRTVAAALAAAATACPPPYSTYLLAAAAALATLAGGPPAAPVGPDEVTCTTIAAIRWSPPGRCSRASGPSPRNTRRCCSASA